MLTVTLTTKRTNVDSAESHFTEHGRIAYTEIVRTKVMLLVAFLRLYAQQFFVTILH